MDTNEGFGIVFIDAIDIHCVSIELAQFPDAGDDLHLGIVN